MVVCQRAQVDPTNMNQVQKWKAGVCEEPNKSREMVALKTMVACVTNLTRTQKRIVFWALPQLWLSERGALGVAQAFQRPEQHQVLVAAFKFEAVDKMSDNGEKHQQSNEEVGEASCRVLYSGMEHDGRVIVDFGSVAESRKQVESDDDAEQRNK